MSKVDEDTKKKKMQKRVMKEIAENYKGIEQSMVNQLLLQVPNHAPTVGTYRETVWKSLLEMIIPKKYQIEQGVFIIDSYGNISAEVDLAVFDEMYTPYIFNYGKVKFIPIEAVAVVVQCKSTINRENTYQNLQAWVGTIDVLKASLDAVIRIISGLQDNVTTTKSFSQTSTRPVKILCATYIAEKMKAKLQDDFDMIIYIEKGRLKKDIKNKREGFEVWYENLNNFGLDRYQKEDIQGKIYEDIRKENCKKPLEADSGETQEKEKPMRSLEQLEVKDGKSQENVIMSLTFQLNQLLMLINNPMLFPHRAYVKKFNEILQGKGFSRKGKKDE